MKTLFNYMTEQQSLFDAWKHVRSNAIQSPQFSTREAVLQFELNLLKNFRKIQRELRTDTFIFDAQKGVTKKKSNGSKRGIVVSSLKNRLVERALLNCLQEQRYIQQILKTPTSVGGVPKKGVAHGLALVQNAMKSKKYFIRSDIKGFFDNISRKRVINIIQQHIADEQILKLLDKATTTILANERVLGEDRKLFPCNEIGVAQGSPLSPLLGNILLQEFDCLFNNDDTTCIRFIDDFIMIGDESNTLKLFNNAKAYLLSLGLLCHDPFNSEFTKDKADYGNITNGFNFLGYYIEPGMLQPSKAARINLVEKIRNQISISKKNILNAVKTNDFSKNNPKYIQTLESINKILRGWDDAFAYVNIKDTKKALNNKIRDELFDFEKWINKLTHNKSSMDLWRIKGIHSLSDSQPKKLENLKNDD